MLTFDYVKTLINADKDVPYRTCAVCKCPMFITRRKFLPHIIGCRCRTSGEPGEIRLMWSELRELLEKKK